MSESEKLDLILSKLDTVEGSAQELKQQTANIGNEMQGLKQQTANIENEMQGLNERTENIGNEMQSLNERTESIGNEVQDLKQRTANIENRTTNIENEMQELNLRTKCIELTLENETSRNIQLLAENHLTLIDKLNQSLRVADKNLVFELKMTDFKLKLEHLEKEVAKMKTGTA